MMSVPDIYTWAECPRDCYWERTVNCNWGGRTEKKAGEPRRKEVKLLTDTRKTLEG